jgi:hypothetical protein
MILWFSDRRLAEDNGALLENFHAWKFCAPAESAYLRRANRYTLVSLRYDLTKLRATGKRSCSYGVLWNAFKRVAEPYSASEKAALFSETAMRVYRLSLE